MKKEKREPKRNMKAIYTFRILGGGYLLYLSYSMLKGWADVPENSKLLIGSFMVVFAIIGAYLAIVSLIKYTRFKDEPAEMNDIVDVENEISETDDMKQLQDSILEDANEAEEGNIEDTKKD